ncbi:MAG: hypothetical protein ACXWC6_02995 [Ramlibacter sp.]
MFSGVALLAGVGMTVAVLDEDAADRRDMRAGESARTSAAAGRSTAHRAQDVADAAIAAVPTPAATAPAPARPSGQVSGALLAEFGQATDLHAFARDALARPAEGGGFYARIAAARCLAGQRASIDGLLQASLQRDQTLTTAQLETAERLKVLCENFPPDAVRQTFLAAREHAADGADPLLAAERLLQQVDAGDRAARRAAAERLLALGDPLFLSESGALLRLARSGGTEEPPGLWFDGRRWSAQDSQKELTAIGMALGVGACGDGSPCSIDAVLAQQCVAHGICDTDRWASLGHGAQREGVPDTLAARAKVLAERVRRAVREQDASFFVH